MDAGLPQSEGKGIQSILSPKKAFCWPLGAHRMLSSTIEFMALTMSASFTKKVLQVNNQVNNKAL